MATWPSRSQKCVQAESRSGLLLPGRCIGFTIEASRHPSLSQASYHRDDYMAPVVSAFDVSVCLCGQLQREALVDDPPSSSRLDQVFEESKVFCVSAYSPWRPEDDLLAAPPRDPLPPEYLRHLRNGRQIASVEV